MQSRQVIHNQSFTARPARHAGRAPPGPLARLADASGVGAPRPRRTTRRAPLPRRVAEAPRGDVGSPRGRPAASAAGRAGGSSPSARRAVRARRDRRGETPRLSAVRALLGRCADAVGPLAGAPRRRCGLALASGLFFFTDRQVESDRHVMGSGFTVSYERTAYERSSWLAQLERSSNSRPTI
jgi:hypothetical protein